MKNFKKTVLLFGIAVFSYLSLLTWKYSAKHLDQKQHIGCTAAVLFCDIRKFTQICQLNDPERVIVFLEKYFEKISEIILKNNGVIHQIWGDGIIAVYLAEGEKTISACNNAFKSAFEISKFTENFDVSRFNLHGIKNNKIKNGAGITLGKVVFGKVKRPQFSVSERIIVGNPMNLASRLQDLNKNEEIKKCLSYKIIISKDVLNGLAEEYQKLFSPLKKQKIKGFEKKIPVFGIKKGSCLLFL